MATRKNKDLAAMAKAAIGTSPTNKGQVAQPSPTAKYQNPLAKFQGSTAPNTAKMNLAKKMTPAQGDYKTQDMPMSTIRAGGAIQKTPGSSTIRAGGAIQKTPMVSQPRVAGMGAVVGSTPSTGTVASRRTATTAMKPKGPAMPTQASPVAMKKKLAVRKKLARKGLAKRSKRLTKRIGG